MEYFQASLSGNRPIATKIRPETIAEANSEDSTEKELTKSNSEDAPKGDSTMDLEKSSAHEAQATATSTPPPRNIHDI